MKKIKFIGLAMLMLFLWSSCQEEELAGSGVGYLRLQLDVNTTVNTKAGYDPMQIAAQIVNAAGQVVKETANWTDWEGESIALEPGSYTLNASSNGFDGQEMAFEKPYYAGSKTFSIEQGKANAVSLTCTLANVKVSVNFGDGFAKYFTEATVTVSPLSSASEGTETANEAATGLVFDMGRPDQGSGYFPVSDLQATLVAKNLKGATIRQTNKMEGVAARDHHILNYSISGGDGEITITVNDRTQEHKYEVGVNPIPTTTLMLPVVNAWSRMAYVDAQAVPDPEGDPLDDTKMKIQYRQKGTDVWTDAVTTAGEGDTYQATIGNLTANTEYECRTSYNNEQFTSEVSSFTTEAETALYDGNFDKWYKSGKSWYLTSEEDATTSDSKGYLNAYWDSGNAGANTIGEKNPTAPEETDVHTPSGKSAKLSSQWVGFLGIGKFAAGNIYTGHYCETITSPMGARLRFGQEFNSRPTQLKGWYKYSRGTDIDYSQNDAYKSELETSGGDKCSIYIALSDNEGLTDDDSMKPAAFEINNSLSADDPEHFQYKNAIDYSENNPHIIAYGTITDDESKGTNGEWKEFTIDLKYRDLKRKPKYIIVVASASKYGDYFTGSTGSVMYLDDFELVYGNNPTTQE